MMGGGPGSRHRLRLKQGTALGAPRMRCTPRGA